MALSRAKEELGLGKSLFLRGEEFSDVKINVENGSSICRFPCHKVILSAASKVFAKMFASKPGEGNVQVTIKGINPKIVYILLKYIYTREINFECWRMAIEVVQAAHQYQISTLMDHCELFLSKNLTLRNVCFILDIAILYELILLKLRCLSLCERGCFVILNTEGFQELSADAVMAIVSWRPLSVNTKMDIFKALWKWATMECCRNKNKLIDDNIFAEFLMFSEYAGFEDMTVEETESLPKSVQEYIISRSMLDEETESNASTETKHDSCNISEGLESYLVTKAFNLNISSIFPRSGSHLTVLSFSVDTDVYLVDVTLMPLSNPNVKEYFKSFRLFCIDKIVAEWNEEEEEMLHLCDNGCHFSSLKDSTEVHEFVFRVCGFISLKANTLYTMEVEPYDWENSPTYWPKVSLSTSEKYCNDDIQLLVHSQNSFAVTKLNFLPAF